MWNGKVCARHFFLSVSLLPLKQQLKVEKKLWKFLLLNKTVSSGKREAISGKIHLKECKIIAKDQPIGNGTYAIGTTKTNSLMGIQQLSIIMELQRSECANNSVKCPLLRSLYLHSTDKKQRKRTNRQVYIDWKKEALNYLYV